MLIMEEETIELCIVLVAEEKATELFWWGTRKQ